MFAVLEAVALPIVFTPVAEVMSLPPLVITTLSQLSLFATVSDPTLVRIAPPEIPLPFKTRRLEPTKVDPPLPLPTRNSTPALSQTEATLPPAMRTEFERAPIVPPVPPITLIVALLFTTTLPPLVTSKLLLNEVVEFAPT